MRVAFQYLPARHMRLVCSVICIGLLLAWLSDGWAQGLSVQASGDGAVAGAKQRLIVRDRHPARRTKPAPVARPSIQYDRKSAFGSSAAEHFAEVELALDAVRTLGRVRLLPRAPRSGLEILDGGTRVRAQWPASMVAELIEEGAEITVLRDFMLSGKEIATGDTKERTAVGLDARPSDESIRCQNDTDVLIPEGDWTRSVVDLQDVPDNAVITSVDVHYKVNHSYVGDLVLELSDRADTIQYRLWNEEGGPADGIETSVLGITAFAGEPAKQALTLWATDLYTGHSGYLDKWSVDVHYEIATVLGVEDVCLGAVTVQDGVPYNGSTVGATGSYVSWCSEDDTRDVWHKFTPSRTGLVTIEVLGQGDFDPTLAVFDRCGGDELACSDDTCNSLDCELTMPMTGGTTYYLRVAGYSRATGAYTLTVDEHAVSLPDQPGPPSPSAGNTSVGVDALLSWNDWSSIAGLSRMSRSRMSIDKDDDRSPKIIYGSDDRQDEYEVTNSNVLNAGDSTVVLVYWDELVRNGDGSYTLPTETFAWWYQHTDPIETGNTLCGDEPYRDQPAAGICSGVLVAPDLIATAGHCVTCADVTNMAAVFGFVMTDALTPVLTFDADQVYRLSDVVAYQEGYPDWSVVRLNRQVTNHTPVNVRTSGQAGVGTDLLIVGHPYGIPRKYDEGGTVRANTAEAFFQANLDAYPGNSGSAVFNRGSLEVEGLLTAGFESFEEDTVNHCDQSRICPDSGCPGWEYISRATSFASVIPSFDVYFGTDPDAMDLVSAYSTVPYYDPGRLQGGTSYYWQVVARNAWGLTEGPLWWFVTASTPDYSPIYRFWAPTAARHFYTISETERDKLINNFAGTWVYEGPVYYAFQTDPGGGAAPVYRFWSDRLLSHFYTISENDRDKLINEYSYSWTYEGPVFYAYPEGRQPAGASPVYRFWSDVIGTHFYTMSEDEKNKVITQLSHIYIYEGVAWYAYQ